MKEVLDAGQLRGPQRVEHVRKRDVAEADRCDQPVITCRDHRRELVVEERIRPVISHQPEVHDGELVDSERPEIVFDAATQLRGFVGDENPAPAVPTRSDLGCYGFPWSTATLDVSVTYTLTEAGRALLPALEQIRRWAERHLSHSQRRKLAHPCAATDASPMNSGWESQCWASTRVAYQANQGLPPGARGRRTAKAASSRYVQPNQGAQHAPPHPPPAKRPPQPLNSSSPGCKAQDRAARSCSRIALTTTSRCIARAPIRPTSPKAREAFGSACATTGLTPTVWS